VLLEPLLLSLAAVPLHAHRQASLAATSHHHHRRLASCVEFKPHTCRMYFALAFFVWGAAISKRMPYLSWVDNAQNLAMLACLVVISALNM
jgi:hypothetical protein